MRSIRHLFTTLLLLGGLQLAQVADARHGPTFVQWLDPMTTRQQAPAQQQPKPDPMATKIESYYQFGFPKAGRSLKQKIQEADAFLKRDITTNSQVVGVGASIVYNDQVVLAKGYGLRQSSDKKSSVSADSMFQIGSVTKSMIAVAIGLLVEEGKVQWTDPVKQHLPWLTLADKYAEQFVTIGDMLSMNSGFGRTPDLALFTGMYGNEKTLVEAMGTLQPESSLRSKPAYGNINFEVLGQVIEAASNQTWHAFLQERVWKPLGMKNTFASANVVPSDLKKTALNSGHEVCQGQIAGPYDMAGSVAADLTAGMDDGLLAAGSVVSSASDMAKFAQLLVNKGKVGKTIIMNATTTEVMTTGKNAVALEVTGSELIGFKFIPGGNTLAAGYGFDFVGDLMWGRAYYDKGGDTYLHHTDTGFAPREKLGVVLMSNSQGPYATVMMSQARSYVMGIFLDVPKDILDYQLKSWRDALPPLEPVFPGVPPCGFSFWKNPPRVKLDEQASSALIGTFVSTFSGEFLPQVIVSRGAKDDEFRFQAGNVNATFFSVGNLGNIYAFLTENAPLGLPAFAAQRDETPEGAFSLDFNGLIYRKE